ncbi:DUF4153 domain-containing protein [Marinilactibacillus sp. Marseille-P9653]|uniref:DUF4153 domain-containing protein n=1 Tax=Marinilactibacillus sp. Marseille-P9653 TaxID=2866583 RepID=UPI001CE414B2|nr:DUF4153 domain-containing protein [Marinilactibacillus sp. Marseille-P9653]
MKFMENSFSKLGILNQSLVRYPVSFLFFLLSTVFMIRTNHSNFSEVYQNPILAYAIGGLLAAVSQSFYERFFSGKPFLRIGLYIISIIVTMIYYIFFLRSYPYYSSIVAIRSSALVAAALTAYVWVPTLKSIVPFDLAFTVAFKAFFTSFLYSMVLVIGSFAIVGTYGFLISEVNFEIFGDLAAIIFGLFAPMCFLSYIPNYNLVKGLESKKDQTSLSIPKLLSFLISYIVIPLLTAYTLILVLYIVPNLAGEFWFDNLLEPLLISYAIIGFITLFISHTIDNNSTNYFKLIFPKVLLVIAIFQTVASLIKIQQLGLTHGRYYVILFGLFSIISSLLYSFSKNKKQYVPVVFIILTILSIVPPIDAMTLGINAQISKLESLLEKNNMLEDNRIIGKSDVSLEDREIIVDSLQYLSDYDALNRIDWLPDNFEFYGENFESVFGFDQYPSQYEDDSTIDETYNPAYTSLQLDKRQTISFSTTDIDQLMIVPFSYDQYVQPSAQETAFQIENDEYNLVATAEEDAFELDLNTTDNETILNFDLSFMLEDNFEFYDTIQDLSASDLTFVENNNQVTLTVIFDNIELLDNESYSGSLYLLVSLKD